MAKKRKKKLIPKSLLLICIITGISVLVLRMINTRLQILELSELNGYVGTAFVISLIIIIGILLFNYVNKR